MHQTAMLEDFRTRPRQTLTGILDRAKQRDPNWKMPASVALLERLFLRDSKTRDFAGNIALRILGVHPRRDHP
ncbi:MAG: hypothetical protein JO061_20290 [Acidobacteriaceae bacterium]|nr:hypothetical protein [Acidobacteriaceae bacterium]